MRICTKYGDRNYNSDGNSSPAANRLRVPYSDSLDSGLNRVKHPSPVKVHYNDQLSATLILSPRARKSSLEPYKVVVQLHNNTQDQ